MWGEEAVPHVTEHANHHAQMLVLVVKAIARAIVSETVIRHAKAIAKENALEVVTIHVQEVAVYKKYDQYKRRDTKLARRYV